MRTPVASPSTARPTASVRGCDTTAVARACTSWRLGEHCAHIAGNGGNTGYAGKLGTGTSMSVTTPTAVKNPVGVKSWILLSAGSEHTCGIADTRWAYCNGMANMGRLGTGDKVSQEALQPQAVAAVGGVEGWTYISAGNLHRCECAVSGGLGKLSADGRPLGAALQLRHCLLWPTVLLG